jgi:hypothetical protein
LLKSVIRCKSHAARVAAYGVPGSNGALSVTLPLQLAINFRRHDADVFFNERELANLLVQPYVRDDVSLIPPVGMQPLSATMLCAAK